MPSFDCALCGMSGPYVRPVMVEWTDPEPYRFSVIPRCVERAECRARVEATGEPWPLVDVKSDERKAVPSDAR